MNDDKSIINWRKNLLGITNSKSEETHNKIIKYVIKRDGQLEFYNPQKNI